MIRRINSNLFMYLNSMSGGGFNFYRYTGSNEIALLCGGLRGQIQSNDNNGNGQKDAGKTSSNVLHEIKSEINEEMYHFGHDSLKIILVLTKTRRSYDGY